MRIRLLQKHDIQGGFSCGESALDTFFAKRAWDHHSKGVSRVYVLEDPAGPNEVLGFYTLSAKEVERERLQKPLPQSLPKYPLPVFYIGYFAVSKARQGQGLGRFLMGDALARCAEGAQIVGAVGVFLDSLSTGSTQFYKELGFEPIPPHPTQTEPNPQPMFLRLDAVLAALPRGARTT